MEVDILEGLDQQQRTEIFTYTDDYYPQLSYVNGKFTINSEDDLKYLFFGIDQRYYTTPVTKEKRVANSVKNMSIT